MTPNLDAPPSYVAGIVNLPVNAVMGFLDLIRTQLDPNTPGGPRELSIYVRSGGNVFIGAASKLGGPLSATNFGHLLATGESLTYRSNYPGSNVPLGQLQILADSASVINVEVIS